MPSPTTKRDLVAMFPVTTKTRIIESDPYRFGTYTEDGKYDFVFCYLALTEDERNYIAEVKVDEATVLSNILYSTVWGYKFSLSTHKEDDYYKATLSGTEFSAMPAHTFSVEADDPLLAAYLLFYKLYLIGYPEKWRVQPKAQRERYKFR